ncbi:MAG: serine/threonine protein kinase [Planctomycetes bacterium]|nr:serine/threonine protein kinase [Planctomycetota bacterium]
MSALVGARAEWEEALRRLQARDLAPPEAVAHAREALAGRPDEGDLSAGLFAFWLDVPEALLADLLREVRAGATAPPATTGAGPAPEGLPRTLGGFDLLAPLGQGGMGRVFRARERALARDVAVKLLAPALAADPGARRRFLREARVLAAVNDPHVITCYSAGELDGQPYIAMELMTGGDAQGLLARAGGALPERRALELARDAALGLAALEAAGLVHRDVKPTNLFLTPGGRAKLGDLGLARSQTGADRLTLTGVAVGTLAFMAPEQIAGAPDLDARVDVYGLGATLYALLTGAPPLRSRGAPGDLARRRPGLSERAVALVQRAMEPEAARRHPGPGALLAAIEEALRAPAPVARTSGQAGAAPGRARPRPCSWWRRSRPSPRCASAAARRRGRRRRRPRPGRQRPRRRRRRHATPGRRRPTRPGRRRPGRRRPGRQRPGPRPSR